MSCFVFGLWGSCTSWIHTSHVWIPASLAATSVTHTGVKTEVSSLNRIQFPSLCSWQSPQEKNKASLDFSCPLVTPLGSLPVDLLSALLSSERGGQPGRQRWRTQWGRSLRGRRHSWSPSWCPPASLMERHTARKQTKDQWSLKKNNHEVTV